MDNIEYAHRTLFEQSVGLCVGCEFRAVGLWDILSLDNNFLFLYFCILLYKK